MYVTLERSNLILIRLLNAQSRKNNAALVFSLQLNTTIFNQLTL